MFHEYPKHINHQDGTFTVVNSSEEEKAILGPSEVEQDHSETEQVSEEATAEE